MTNSKLYAERDPYALSPHFERHMLALTGERLESKSAIAAELAHRDAEIERLRAALSEIAWYPGRGYEIAQRALHSDEPSGCHGPEEVRD